LITSWAVELWQWTKAHDLPNWIAVGITAIIWPIAILLWNSRKINNVPGFEMHLRAGELVIFGKSHSAVSLDFRNHTGSVVYVTGVRIRPCALFPVATAARRDIGTGMYDLSFLDKNNGFTLREITLQTNESTNTAIGITDPMPDVFYKYKSPWYRQWSRWPTYFVLEYTALVGTTRHRVATVY